tara:strand:- start:637 stop:765 length:129 start_codon:yes stop_codon:yes gene_type:complete
MLPIRDVLGDDRPLRARINSTPVNKYNNAEILADIFSSLTFY